MKPERGFIAERMVANHCAELLPVRPTHDDTPAALQPYGERLAQSLASGIAGLLGTQPKVKCCAPRSDSMQDIAMLAPRLAAWSVFELGRPGAHVLASIDGAAVFQLVDRAFGGTGSLPDMLPDAFPLSADLFIERIETMIAAALSEAIGGNSRAIACVERASDPARLKRLEPGESLFVLDFDIQGEDQPAWKLMLALPQAARAIVSGYDPAPPAPGGSRRARANPANEPFGSLPLPLSAVLVDMAIGFSRLSGLQAGDILPVAVARNVPLKVGEHTIAFGAIGEIDDRVAVRITKAF